MARKQRKIKLQVPEDEPKGWSVIGVDMSMSSISAAIISWDRLLDRLTDVHVKTIRWQKDTPYYERMTQATLCRNFIWDLMSESKAPILGPKDVYIGVEEPWPMGIVKRADSQWLKQQAQLQGAFIGGLCVAGFENLFEVNNMSWKKRVADDLGIKTGQSKDFKWVVKEWALKSFENLPDLPDLIHHKELGLIPKPETSRAQPKQPDDIYDACGVMNWVYVEMDSTGELDN